MHVLIVGSSGSGKTNLAKRFAADAVTRGEAVIVYDPMMSAGWPEGAEKYTTPRRFFQRMMQAQSAHVFIDEAKTLWNHDTKRADALLYQKRHQGLLFYVIGQRAEGMIPPNARNQCSRVFAFRQSHKDSETLALEYSEELRGCAKLGKDAFIYSDSFNSGRAALDYSGGIPPAITSEGNTDDD
jgi:hypothetical protein